MLETCELIEYTYSNINMQKKKIKKLGKKKGITIDDLAMMVQRGFENTATKDYVDKHFDAIDKRFDAVDKRLDGIDIRLNRIENLLLRAHENRIEILEDKMRQVQTTLGK